MGPGTQDDAAVYRLNEDLALIQTVDFFPPIVDDPFLFGEIAAANAMSDVYAMGGHPLLGLNIVGFPAELPKQTLTSILQGGASKASEAGMLIVGGHTIDDKEPKYGMSVTGLVHPGKQVTNAGAQPGDLVVLTKPIGTGIITTASKQNQASSEILDIATSTMNVLNRAASEAMNEVGVNACVDVTGFGLIGHLLGMLKSSMVGARISFSSVPLLEGATNLLEKGIKPGGTVRNLESSDDEVHWDTGIQHTAKLMLSDAQTSGGLLMSVTPQNLDGLINSLTNHGVHTRAVIGEVLEYSDPKFGRLQVTL